jgi:hypothetical protein
MSLHVVRKSLPKLHLQQISGSVLLQMNIVPFLQGSETFEYSLMIVFLYFFKFTKCFVIY